MNRQPILTNPRVVKIVPPWSCYRASLALRSFLSPLPFGHSLLDEDEEGNANPHPLRDKRTYLAITLGVRVVQVIIGFCTRMQPIKTLAPARG